jgi:hypothetical protein
VSTHCITDFCAGESWFPYPEHEAVGKSIFHVVGTDPAGTVLERVRFRRDAQPGRGQRSGNIASKAIQRLDSYAV